MSIKKKYLCQRASHQQEIPAHQNHAKAVYVTSHPDWFCNTQLSVRTVIDNDKHFFFYRQGIIK